MMRRYGAPSTDSWCSLLIRSMICTGQKNSASAMTSASPTPSPAATPMARLIF